MVLASCCSRALRMSVMSCCMVLMNNGRIAGDSFTLSLDVAAGEALGFSASIRDGLLCSIGLHSLVRCTRKVCRLRGLTIQAFIPTSMQRKPSSRIALAVTPMIGNWLPLARSALASS
ncbi:hypothetical protein D3C75_1099880 [compost metagenome]